jgi:hypothetical protein
MFHRTTFDSRFVIETDDVYHRLMEVIHLCLLSLAVLATQPVCYMAYPSYSMSMFLFSLALTLERVMVGLRYVELYMFGIGQHMIKTFAIREFV